MGSAVTEENSAFYENKKQFLIVRVRTFRSRVLCVGFVLFLNLSFVLFNVDML